MRSNQRSPTGSLGARLLALTVVPVAALSVLGMQRIDQDNDRADHRAAIVETVEFQRTIADVMPSAQLERFALEGLSRVDGLGVPREIVVAFTGVDLEETYGANLIVLERSLDTLQDQYRDLRLPGDRFLGEELARIRQSIEVQRNIVDSRKGVSDDIGTVFDDLDKLLDTALLTHGRLDESEEQTNIHQVRVQLLGDVLDSADQYGRGIVRGLVYRSAAIRDETLSALAVHESNVARLTASLDPDSAAAFSEVTTHLVRFDLPAVDDASGAAERALDPIEVRESATLALGHLDYLRELHEFSSSLHDATAGQLAAEADAARSNANRTTWILLAIAVVTALLALGVVWSIVVPIRRLTERARNVSDGELDLPPIPERGPSDVRALTNTVNDMLSTLHAVDSEVQRLASGQDDGSDALELPGAIGISIRESFERLGSVNEELQHSKQLSSAIVNEAGDAIWTTDEYGAILTANEAAAVLVDVTVSEQLGCPIADFLDRSDGQARLLTPSRARRTALVSRSSVQNGDDRIDVIIAHDISERTEFEERLAYQAHHDALTGLPNRFAVLDHMATELAKSEPIGVLFIDLDGFKAVNDSQGHAAGDQVLTDVAQTLLRSVRDDEFVGRLGGDEFVIVTRRSAQTADVSALGHRLIREIEQPRVLGDRLFVLSASVGVAIVEPGTSALDAIRRADNALYQAKRMGRGRVGVFDATMQELIEHETDLEMALRQAVRNDELVLHLQPLTDLPSGRVNGAEALVRWERPGHGMVPPGDFIPIAERTSLIYEIERWVLHRACELVVDWRRRSPGCTHRIAVNVSGRHLIEGDLLADVNAVLDLTGADPSMLELELTESQLLEDLDRATQVLDALRAKGIRIAIDDFGTGYSSMTYLRELPIDAVKIDGSFVARATEQGYDSTVIDALLSIGRALGLSVVAEGIETEAQLAYMSARGCDRAQGFLLARPMPIEDAELVLFENQPSGDRALSASMAAASVAPTSMANVH